MRKVVTYVTSDDKEYKTKEAAERHENELTMKSAGFEKKEVDEYVKKIREDNHKLDLLLESNNEDWRNLNEHLVNQLPVLIKKQKRKEEGYAIFKLQKQFNFSGNNFLLEIEGDKPKNKKEGYPKEFTEFAEKQETEDDEWYEIIFDKDEKDGNVTTYIYTLVLCQVAPEDKLAKGTKLTEDDLSELVQGFTIKENLLYLNRWSVTTESIIKLDNGDLYKIEWEQAATESQESYFNSQPVRVKKTEITIEHYEEIKNNKG